MERRKKELAFLAVGVLLLGAALYTTFKPRAKPAAAEQPKRVAQAPAAHPDAPSGAEEPAAASPEPSEPKDQAARTHRDPFAGAKAGAAVASSSISGAQRPASSGLQPMPPQLNTGRLHQPTSIAMLPFPGMTGVDSGLQPIPGMMPSMSGATAGAGPEAGHPADTKLRLTGIIEGDPTIAILRKGDAHYIVRQGDPVQGYVVESIGGRRVVLAAGGKTKSLFLGGRL